MQPTHKVQKLTGTGTRQREGMPLYGLRLFLSLVDYICVVGGFGGRRDTLTSALAPLRSLPIRYDSPPVSLYLLSIAD